jgi:hypothetical protein
MPSGRTVYLDEAPMIYAVGRDEWGCSTASPVPGRFYVYHRCSQRALQDHAPVTDPVDDEAVYDSGRMAGLSRLPRPDPVSTLVHPEWLRGFDDGRQERDR